MDAVEKTSEDRAREVAERLMNEKNFVGTQEQFERVFGKPISNAEFTKSVYAAFNGSCFEKRFYIKKVDDEKV